MKITRFLAGNKITGYEDSKVPVVQESKTGSNYVLVATDGFIEDNTFHKGIIEGLFADAVVLEQLKVGMEIA